MSVRALTGAQQCPRGKRQSYCEGLWRRLQLQGSGSGERPRGISAPHPFPQDALRGLARFSCPKGQPQPNQDEVSDFPQHGGVYKPLASDLQSVTGVRKEAWEGGPGWRFGEQKADLGPAPGSARRMEAGSAGPAG